MVRALPLLLLPLVGSLHATTMMLAPGDSLVFDFTATHLSLSFPGHQANWVGFSFVGSAVSDYAPYTFEAAFDGALLDRDLQPGMFSGSTYSGPAGVVSGRFSLSPSEVDAPL